jgi:hypothetical protein
MPTNAKADVKAATPGEADPELTSYEDDLYLKVRTHCVTTNTSYPLSKDEQKVARRLVNRGQLFYSMDRDHVRSYARH